jgi:hypothetical protein
MSIRPRRQSTIASTVNTIYRRSQSAKPQTTIRRREIPDDSRFSETGLVVVPALSDDGENEHFYIRTDLEGKLEPFADWLLDINKKTVYFNGDDTYYKVTSKRAVRIEDPDCLLFAEGLCIKNPKYNDEDSQLFVKHSKGFRKTRLFGVGYKENIKLSNTFYSENIDGVNENANPVQGDAYAIVRQGDSTKKKMTPYHIAYVILTDGDDRITIELDAGNVLQTRPIFDIYSISSNGRYESFHSRFKDDYSIRGIEPITVVLAPVKPFTTITPIQ